MTANEGETAQTRNGVLYSFCLYNPAKPDAKDWFFAGTREGIMASLAGVQKTFWRRLKDGSLIVSEITEREII